MVSISPKQAIHEALQRVVHDTLGIFSATFTVEHPADVSHGDYATNVALVVAKEAGKSPREVAETLAVALRAAAVPHVAEITIAGPGFINFTLDRVYFANVVAESVRQPNAWGAQPLFAGEEVLLEYTSPNLFKPLHVGNLVGNIIGESLARLYAFLGAKVVRLNYPSDIGLTVAKSVWGLQKHGLNPDDVHALGKAYVLGTAAYDADEGAKAEIEAVNRALYAGNDSELSALREHGIATSRVALDAMLAKLGTTFDGVFFESDAGPRGMEIVREHIADGIFEESDGAVIYRGEKHGLHTRVFLNSQGLPTYEAKDVGGFTIKHERYPEWTRMLIVTGGEQREYFKVIFAAIRDIFTHASNRMLAHIPTGFLTLTTGKMSSRKGNVLTGEEILGDLREEALLRAAESRADDKDVLADVIATAALKYQILRQAVGTDIVFDKAKALSFEGASGPYLQYTYARIGSAVAKAHETGVASSIAHAPSVPYALERMVYRFPEVVAAAAQAHEPHHLVTYLTELAGAFNTFYAHEKIADAADEFAPYKTALAESVRVTLGQGIYLLGFVAPEKM